MASSEMLAFLCVLAMVNPVTPSESSEIALNEYESLMKQEYCVKIVMVCYLLWDSPPDYDEEQDILQYDSSGTKTLNEEIDEDLRKAGCIPENLKSLESGVYWKTVRIWQQEVKKQFLSSNIFVVKEELDNGKAMKINLWNVFKIRMFVICNRTKGTDDSDDHSIASALVPFDRKPITANTEMNYCNPRQDVGLWINDQIKGEAIIDYYIIESFGNVLDKLEIDVNRNCCPYSIIRDRVEVINDVIDVIMQLRSPIPYERSASTGFAWLDLQNLLVRLEFIKDKGVKAGQTGNCCYQLDESVIDTKLRFQNEKNLLLTTTSANISNKHETEFLNNFQQNLARLQSRVVAIQKIFNETEVNGRECCSSQPSLSNMARLINEFKITESIDNSPKDLKSRLISTNATINKLQDLLNLDRNREKLLVDKCSEICADKPKKRENFKLKKLEKKAELIATNMKNESFDFQNKNWTTLNDTINNAAVKLAEMNKKLDGMLGNLSNLSAKKSESEANKSPTNKTDSELSTCLNAVKLQANDFEELMKIYNSNMDSHRNKKLETAMEIIDLNEKLNRKIIMEKKSKHFVPLEKPPIGSLVTLADQIGDQSKLIKDLENNLTKNFTDQSRLLEAKKAKDLETNKNIELRINELERKLNDTKMNRFNSSIDYPLTTNKLDYLEARLKSMTKQSKDSLKHLLETIEKLENRLKTVNKQINDYNEKAKKCSVDCDWGELPSIDELMNRLKNLNAKSLKKSKKAANSKSKGPK